MNMLTASDVYANPPPAAAAREPIVVLENVSVQYRDALGNLSPVYCDDISLEGMPAPPPP